jgi:hypothetical protein
VTLAVEEEMDPVAAEQIDREVGVAAELRVPDRGDGVPVVGVPAGREPVQAGDVVGRLAPQLEPQEVGEQVVVPEPRAADVVGDDERVGLLELAEQPRPVAAAGQQIGERGIDPFEDARAQEQVAHLRRMAGQHLAQQVVGDRALAAGELGHEPLRRRVP